MKQFHSKLEKLYEGLNLKKTYTEDSKRPDFNSEDFILAAVYDYIDSTLDFDWDYSDKDLANDLIGQFKQLRDLIETRYTAINKEDIEQEEIYGTFYIGDDELVVSIHDVEDRIDLGGREGRPLGGSEIKDQLEILLRDMGYDVNSRIKGIDGKYEVQISWKHITGDDIDTFELVQS